jgi:hypothetical protein
MNEGQSKGSLARWGRLMVIVCVLVIPRLTLWPTPSGIHREWLWCVLCGERAVADALLNLGFFVPLGVALILAGRRPGTALMLAALLSIGVELGQLGLRGRYATLGDFVFNVGGAGAGILLVRSASLWLLPPARRAARLSLAAGLLLPVVIAGTGWLVEPFPPPTLYFGQWTPDLRNLQQYEGRVLQAEVGGVDLPAGRREDSESLRARLLAGGPILIEGIAGRAPVALAPILAVYDDHPREVFLVGAQREDLVFRYYLRGMAIRLDQPSLRLEGAFDAIGVGERFSVRITREGAGYCLQANGTRRCGAGFTAGSGWGLLLFAESAPRGVKRFLNAAWLLALVLPLGFWTRRRWESVAGVAVATAALLLLPARVGLIPTPAFEWAGALTGLMLGASAAYTARRLARRSRLAPPTPRKALRAVRLPPFQGRGNRSRPASAADPQT